MKIKQLDFIPDGHNSYEAPTNIGNYEIYKMNDDIWKVKYCLGVNSRRLDYNSTTTIDAAKKLAQQHYERLIMENLE